MGKTVRKAKCEERGHTFHGTKGSVAPAQSEASSSTDVRDGPGDSRENRGLCSANEPCHPLSEWEQTQLDELCSPSVRLAGEAAVPNVRRIRNKPPGPAAVLHGPRAACPTGGAAPSSGFWLHHLSAVRAWQVLTFVHLCSLICEVGKVVVSALWLPGSAFGQNCARHMLGNGQEDH